MDTVAFTQMIDGTKEEYEFLSRLEKPYIARTAQRVMAELARQGEDSLSGYKISRLEHGLQAATRALRDKADIDWVVGALLHDIGDGLAPLNHDRFAAEIIRPYLRQEVTWVVKHHGIFQTYFYGHHYGWDRNARDQYKGHRYFQSCADFCERWDQKSFDPDYKTESLAFFKPMVEKVFAHKAFDKRVLRKGEVIGLPAPR